MQDVIYNYLYMYIFIDIVKEKLYNEDKFHIFSLNPLGGAMQASPPTRNSIYQCIQFVPRGAGYRVVISVCFRR